MKGDIAFAGFMLTAEEWQALDAECVVPFEQLFGSRSPAADEGQLVPQMLRIPVRSCCHDPWPRTASA